MILVWAGQVSYVWSRTRGTADNIFFENQQSSQFQTTCGRSLAMHCFVAFGASWSKAME